VFSPQVGFSRRFLRVSSFSSWTSSYHPPTTSASKRSVLRLAPTVLPDVSRHGKRHYNFMRIVSHGSRQHEFVPFFSSEAYGTSVEIFVLCCLTFSLFKLSHDGRCTLGGGGEKGTAAHIRAICSGILTSSLSVGSGRSVSIAYRIHATTCSSLCLLSACIPTLMC